MDVLITATARYLVIVIGLIALVATILSESTVRNRIIRLAVMSFAIASLLALAAGAIHYHAPPFVTEDTAPLIHHQPDNSFPSHHTLAALVTAAVIFVYMRRLGFLLGILGLLVGAARIMVKLHYPLDIAGSILIAAIAVGIAWLLLKKLGHKFGYSP